MKAKIENGVLFLLAESFEEAADGKDWLTRFQSKQNCKVRLQILEDFVTANIVGERTH